MHERYVDTRDFKWHYQMKKSHCNYGSWQGTFEHEGYVEASDIVQNRLQRAQAQE